jgi:septum site-determining protein MinC
MALVVVPELPLAAWFEALDEQLHRAAGFFADRPVVANLSTVQEDETADLAALLDALEARGMKLVAVEGTDATRLSGTRWERLTNLRQRLEDTRETVAGRVLAIPDDPPEPEPVSAPNSLLIDRPVRSGQSIIFEDGDVTVIGPVASGAEVIAGGSIHIYGTLRGRVIAGLKSGAEARIFCSKLSAEMVCIDGVYDTAEQWSETFNGRAVQIQLDQGELKFSTLD